MTIANKTSEEFLLSRLPQITRKGVDDRSRSTPKHNSLPVLNSLAQQSKRNPEQQLVPKNPKIVLNIKEQDWELMGDLQASRSSSRIGPLHRSAPSVIHDALGGREHKHDESTGELQHDMLARAQELNAKLQEELKDCQKQSSMVAKRLAAEHQRKWTEWQKEKQQQQHKEEIQKIKEDHALELGAQKEALQKATKVEIDMVKGKLMQIEQLNRTNCNSQGEKRGQEIDLEVPENTIANQEEDLIKANGRVRELMQAVDEQSHEIGSLHTTIRDLGKTAKEAISQAKRSGREVEIIKKELEATQKEITYALDSAADNETAPGSCKRAWDSSNCTLQSGSQAARLNMVMEKLATKKALVDSQSCQINLLRKEILRLEKANEEDNTVTKEQRMNIRSLEGLPQTFSALIENIDNLKAEINELSRVRAQDRVIIKQQQSEIGKLLATRAKLKKVQESLYQKQINLSQAMIRLEKVKATSEQQQSEIQELVITKAKLEELQKSLNTKQTILEKTMMRLEQVNRELQYLRRSQGKGIATREEPPESNQGQCALTDRLIHSEPKSGTTSSYLYQQNRRSPPAKIAKTPAAPKDNNNLASSFRDVELGGRDETSRESKDDDDSDDDDDDDDDEDENLYKLLQKGVSRGAAIITKLENEAERLVTASGWLGGSEK